MKALCIRSTAIPDMPAEFALSPLQYLWKEDSVEWHPAQRLPDYTSRRFHRHQTGYVQPLLLDDEQTGKA